MVTDGAASRGPPLRQIPTRARKRRRDRDSRVDRPPARRPQRSIERASPRSISPDDALSIGAGRRAQASVVGGCRHEHRRIRKRPITELARSLDLCLYARPDARGLGRRIPRPQPDLHHAGEGAKALRVPHPPAEPDALRHRRAPLRPRIATLGVALSPQPPAARRPLMPSFGARTSTRSSCRLTRSARRRMTPTPSISGASRFQLTYYKDATASNMSCLAMEATVSRSR